MLVTWKRYKYQIPHKFVLPARNSNTILANVQVHFLWAIAVQLFTIWILEIQI